MNNLCTAKVFLKYFASYDTMAGTPTGSHRNAPHQRLSFMIDNIKVFRTVRALARRKLQAAGAR